MYEKNNFEYSVIFTIIHFIKKPSNKTLYICNGKFTKFIDFKFVNFIPTNL